MKKIFNLTNFFLSSRLGKNGEPKGSTYRKLRKDTLIIASKLEETINCDLKRWQFDAQRQRADIMLETIKQIEIGTEILFKKDTEHNCFWLRMRIEQLRDFLIKYSLLLNKFNNKHLETLHKDIQFRHATGLVIEDNLLLKGEEIEIRR